MKALQILILVAVICALHVQIRAQADCGYMANIYVEDSAGNPVTGAVVKIWKEKLHYSEKTKAFFFWDLMGVNSTATGELEIKAEEFETFRRTFRYRCGKELFRVRLKKKKSDESAGFERSGFLGGSVTDDGAAVVVGVRVRATDRAGRAFETETDELGFYRLDLFPEVYRVDFTASGFETFSIKDLTIEAGSTDRNAYLRNIVLKPLDLEPCGYGGQCPSWMTATTPVETSGTKISNSGFMEIYSGWLKGRVTDAGGGAIEDVKITATDKINGKSYTSKSNAEGIYDLNVPTGRYDFEFKHGKGFLTTIVRDFFVDRKKKYNFDLTLEVDLECPTCVYSEFVCQTKGGKELDCDYVSRRGKGNSPPKIIEFSDIKNQIKEENN
ncbi:MAG: carboxypeptidase-like regulatory domain-containing protein [Pyrinomonadaceae bacterium]